MIKKIGLYVLFIAGAVKGKMIKKIGLYVLFIAGAVIVIGCSFVIIYKVTVIDDKIVRLDHQIASYRDSAQVELIVMGCEKDSVGCERLKVFYKEYTNTVKRLNEKRDSLVSERRLISIQ